MTLAVGVPSAYDEYWPKYERMWKAIAWAFIACLVATVEFTGLYLVGTEFVNVFSLVAPVGAFLVTYLAWLSVRITD